MFIGFMLVVVVALCAGKSAAGESCRRQAIGSCICEFDDGRLLDITELSSQNPNEPILRQYDVAELGDVSYNPCHGFVCKANDPEAAICHYTESQHGQRSYELALQADSIGFLTDDGNYEIEYKAFMGGYHSKAIFSCLQDDARAKEKRQITLIGRQIVIHFPSTLYCDFEGKPKGISIGSILLIVCFTCAAAYLVLGVLYNTGCSKSTDSSFFPHTELWRNFGANVALGITYLSGFCQKHKTNVDPIP